MAEQRPIQLVIADDHALVAEGLAKLFADAGGFRVIARCRNGEEALQTTLAMRPDVLILDLRMPLLDGLGVLRELANRQSPTRVVSLTAEAKDEELVELMKLGVAGIVLKDSDWSQLIQCVRRVHAGEQWIDQRCAQRALGRVLRRQAGVEEAGRILTSRELEIVGLVAGGLRNQEIADRLCISVGTVKIHLHNVYEKLEISDRRELTQYARSRSLI
ncbi:MAG TPA: response regulator transcription factor [Thermoanaerobaculia bacterium]|nr:response regulator transcription factor [Thermoanaerobaculia bacterium]